MTESSQNHTSRLHWAILFGVALTLIVIDQIAKAIIVANFELYETWIPIPALGRVFDITYTQNTGAAFGMFSSAGTFFLIVAGIATLVIIHYYRQIDEDAWPLRLAMGMQLGGALGNAIDRLTRGFVVDFIHVHYQPHFDYPVFNIADGSIVIGVGMLLLLIWREDREKTRQQEALAVVPEEEQSV